jgi:hypothetical protein
MPGGRGLKRPRIKFSCSAKEVGEKVSTFCTGWHTSSLVLVSMPTRVLIIIIIIIIIKE